MNERETDDLTVEQDLWWTAMVILMTTGGHPNDYKTKIKRKDKTNKKKSSR
tara:strand:- start:3009 stop:3161 length:153 start_codon:yes stop_codon:yes gene_type:complete